MALSWWNALGYLEFDAYPIARPVVTLVVVVLCMLGVGERYFAPLRGGFGWLARRRGLALVAVFGVSFLLTSLPSWKRGIPLPHVHDEFSYLLAGDTFARGRLTNPTPAMAEHFETMHVLVRPTYMSKYPPGQGVALAFGQIVAGRPIVGVWVSTALAAAMLCWCFYGFVSPNWAMLGGLICAGHPQLIEWGNRYWGGSVAVIGGAMVLGSLVRLAPLNGSRRGAAAWPSVIGAAGLVVLANSRPFEAFLYSVILLVVWGIARHRAKVALPSVHALVAAVIVLAVGGVWMGWYNFRVTGNALRLPYVEHHARYGVVPLLIVQERSPEPEYVSDELRLFYTREQEYWYSRRESWVKLREEAWKNVGRLYDGALGNVDSLAAAFLVLPWFVRKNRTVLALTVVLGMLLLGLMSETYLYPHYAAPAAGGVGALVLLLLRRLHRTAHPLGPAAARSAIGVAVVWGGFWWVSFSNWKPSDGEFAVRRQRVVERLAGEAGKHLVIVKYGDHNVHEEWVYNGADLDGMKVVWARSLGEGKDRDLIQAFGDRVVWMLEPDVAGTGLVRWRDESN